MDRETAVELANLWVELPEVQELANAYGQMTGAVRQFLPDSVKAGSAAIVNGTPSVVAFDDDSLFLVRFETSDSAPGTAVLATRYPLRPGDVTVEARESMTDRGERVRGWTFALGRQSSLTISAYVTRRDDWADGPSDSERFARELARKVGWQAPFERERP